MAITAFKRFLMEIELTKKLARPILPKPYSFVAWEPTLIFSHADTKYRCFVKERDSVLFPCLRKFSGCLRLMIDISSRKTFLPNATWLISRDTDYFGSVQGTIEPEGFGMIQNLGIVPDHRGKGFGKSLLLKSLHGYLDCGVKQVQLEVTASNRCAVELYKSVGFQQKKVLFRTVER